MKSQLSIIVYLYHLIIEDLKCDFLSLKFEFEYYFLLDLTIATAHSSISILPNIFVISFFHICFRDTLPCFQSWSLDHTKHFLNFDGFDEILRSKIY